MISIRTVVDIAIDIWSISCAELWFYMMKCCFGFNDLISHLSNSVFGIDLVCICCHYAITGNTRNMCDCIVFKNDSGWQFSVLHCILSYLCPNMLIDIIQCLLLHLLMKQSQKINNWAHLGTVSESGKFSRVRKIFPSICRRSCERQKTIYVNVGEVTEFWLIISLII